MQIGSLFSGIGGFDLAARWMGWETKWYSEIDPYACRVMEKHFGEAYNVGDITRWQPRPEDAVDVVCGGFPCQPVSVAGKRLAQDDERWLWPEFARVLGVLRPRYVVIENVPGLRSRGMADVLRDLSKIGYDAEWTSLSAADVGAPHKRERVWIVAYPSGERRDAFYGRGPLPNEDGLGKSAARQTQQQPRTWGDGAMADPVSINTGRYSAWWPSGVGWWEREPEEALRIAGEGRGEENGLPVPQSQLGRVAHGIPSRVDRLKCLGNAIVPQCAYEIFKCLREVS